MHLYKDMRNFLCDYEYSISFYSNNIHVFNYKDIVKLTDEEIILAMADFLLNLKGKKFVVKQLQKREILISGKLENVGFNYED